MADDQNLTTWENAEVERSAREASDTRLERLHVAPRDIARYLNPPADTCFPLEYSYYLLDAVRGKVVLDYGCGSGGNTVLLANRGARVLSMDLSESLIRLAQNRLKINSIAGNVRFLTGSAHNIPLQDESVDVVFGIAILHHLDLALASPEVHRVLRTYGRAIFSRTNSELCVDQGYSEAYASRSCGCFSLRTAADRQRTYEFWPQFCGLAREGVLRSAYKVGAKASYSPQNRSPTPADGRACLKSLSVFDVLRGC